MPWQVIVGFAILAYRCLRCSTWVFKEDAIPLTLGGARVLQSPMLITIA